MEIVARFDYEAQADDEISIRTGELGIIENKDSEEWWTMRFGNPVRVGLVPQAYVSKIICFVKADFDYDAQDDTEISFREGDKIIVIEKLDMDWWVGIINARQGMFPSAYVKTMNPPDTKKSTPEKKTPTRSISPVSSSPEPELVSESKAQPVPLEPKENATPIHETKKKSQGNLKKSMIDVHAALFSEASAMGTAAKLRKSGRFQHADDKLDQPESKSTTRAVSSDSAIRNSQKKDSELMGKSSMENLNHEANFESKEIVELRKQIKTLMAELDSKNRIIEDLTFLSNKQEQELSDKLAKSEFSRKELEKKLSHFNDLEKERMDSEKLESENRKHLQRIKELSQNIDAIESNHATKLSEKDQEIRSLTLQIRELSSPKSPTAARVSPGVSPNSDLISGFMELIINGSPVLFSVSQTSQKERRSSSKSRAPKTKNTETVSSIKTPQFPSNSSMLKPSTNFQASKPFKSRKPSYADKAREGSLSPISKAALNPAALKQCCNLCFSAGEECLKFTANQFKPDICGTCRHNKSHHLW